MLALSLKQSQCCPFFFLHFLLKECIAWLKCKFDKDLYADRFLQKIDICVFFVHVYLWHKYFIIWLHFKFSNIDLHCYWKISIPLQLWFLSVSYRTCLEALYLAAFRIPPFFAEKNESKRRIVQTIVWFTLALVISLYVTDIQYAIDLIGGLTALFIFFFPGKQINYDA